jgi:hypothetical protein
MKRFAIALATAALAALLMQGVAYANFAIHGGYTADTDACAGCHRAHTSVSSITWSDLGGTSRSALLVSTATQMYQFCYACHDNTAQGADTNVEGGIYEGNAFGTTGNRLNGGVFGLEAGPNAGKDLNNMTVTSTHMYNGASWGAYGGGVTGEWTANNSAGQGAPIPMDCATCHDPHGSSNYRLLKDKVPNGLGGSVAVGGYDALDNPTPFVTSVETGYPATGWLKHAAGAAQMAAYQPNFTKPMYAQAPGGDVTKGMSGWCAGCHTQYINENSSYDAGDSFGVQTRHRHEVNIAMQAAVDRTGVSLVLDPVANPLPLEHANAEVGAPANGQSDTVGCLTCHVAHGTTATMSGWAANADDLGNPPFPNGETGNRASMLLRLNNRGVCEVCHNK